MIVRPSSRLGRLGSSIFAEVAQWKRDAAAGGLRVIDLGIGSPDQPPIEAVRSILAEAALRPDSYGYPTSEGSIQFRSAAADWLRHRFGIEVDAEREITVLMGSQDGLGHLALAVTEPGDLAILPDPGYPIYGAGLAVAGVEPYPVPLVEENGYLFPLDDIPSEIAEKAKFIVVNYPSNPLSVVADRSFYEKLVAFAERYKLLIVHDAAYSELAFDGFRPMSILEIPGAKNVAIEFHSLSKSFNMAGCRIAFAVGNREAVAALRQLKANLDYGVFTAVQEAGIAALHHDLSNAGEKAVSVYQRRRDLFVGALRRAGWPVPVPQATMFLWAPVPAGWSSRQIAREICRQAGVVVVPGNAFGAQGEGYVRIAFVQQEEVLLEAAERLGRFFRENGIVF
ncbi:aminotransferase class I/II-fold pyridoxal phosphate-dependent enzyme [Paenibacillus thermotolerans]|uniref:aminotransferase class I/II-fold pyridoxal phosphate-dependent enzyme n=1 Tax=Paenibacillus thermotolerans TaxID=3027807 RepID=UPI002367F59F|nr:MULTISPECIES: aminotransferase class I/II-fold pyridoxal phosphate-dependent enzyme [unclassified Paenibacillus]